MGNFKSLVYADSNLTKTIADNPQIPRQSSDPRGFGPYATCGARAHLHPDVCRALGLMLGWITVPDFAVTKIGSGDYACEYELSSGKIGIVHMSFKNGKLEAAEYNPASKRLSPYEPISTASETDCTPIMACIIAHLWNGMSDGTYDNMPVEISYSNFMDLSAQWFAAGCAAADVPNELTYAAHVLSETICGAAEDGSTLKISLTSDGNINQITKNALSPLKSGNVVFGEAKVLVGSGVSSVKAGTTLGQAKLMYNAFSSSFAWTEEERALIGGGEDYDDTAEVAEEVLQMAKLFVQTYHSKVPLKNFQFVGPTGIGKSVSVSMLSHILGIPLLRFTCNDKTETEDFLSTLIPETGESYGDISNITPSYMVYDPEGAWEQMTGEVRESVSEEECLSMYLKLKSQGEGTRFKHVISNYAKALINGYIIEVQEASRIRQQGALAGLNECDRPGAFIRLTDGSYARRHENAMVIFTDNSGFDSCHDIEPSVLRRMGVKFIAKDLPKNTLISRIKQNTGFDNDAMLDKMYDIWTETKQYCQEQGLTSGSIGTVELENWVKVVMVLGPGELQYAWEITVANKAINNSDDATEDLNALIAQISPKFEVL